MHSKNIQELCTQHEIELNRLKEQHDFYNEEKVKQMVNNNLVMELKHLENIKRIKMKMNTNHLQEKDNHDKHSLIERMMLVHAVAPYRINLALEKALCDCDVQSDIIHMTDYVQETGSEKHMAYAASKAALHNLTLSFAKKLAPKVKVNSIAPALLMFNEGDDEAYKQKALEKSLLEIVPGAQEAVKAVNYLFDSDYVTGQTLHLNGGRHLK